jgi:hypothetical protein
LIWGLPTASEDVATTAANAYLVAWDQQISRCSYELATLYGDESP